MLHVPQRCSKDEKEKRGGMTGKRKRKKKCRKGKKNETGWKRKLILSSYNTSAMNIDEGSGTSTLGQVHSISYI